MNRLLSFNPEPFESEQEIGGAFQMRDFERNGFGKRCGCQPAASRGSSPYMQGTSAASRASNLSASEVDGEISPNARRLTRPRPAAPSPGASRCPADTKYTLIGFGRYSDDTWKLPDTQYQKLLGIINQIKAPVVPPAKPVTQIVVIGHADIDPARETHEPGFLQFISEKRAMAVYHRLCCTLAAKLKDDLARVGQLRWLRVGRGARALAVPNPRTEADRMCNRRVEIILKHSDPTSSRWGQLLPKLDDSEERLADVEANKVVSEYYLIALQGTSGQFDRPEIAELKAREIAEKIPSFIDKRRRERILRRLYCPDYRIPGSEYNFAIVGCIGEEIELPYFKNALQGTASKFSDPDVVIKKAMEAAEIAASLGFPQLRTKIRWKYAKLPQPMDDDCEAGGRVQGAPASHVVCRTHGHVLDVSKRQVIAHDPEEYKKALGRSSIAGTLMKRQFTRKT